MSSVARVAGGGTSILPRMVQAEAQVAGSVLPSRHWLLAMIARRAAAAVRPPAVGELDLRATAPVLGAYLAALVATDFVNDWLCVGLVGRIPPAIGIALNMLVWWGMWAALMPAALLVSKRALPARVGWRRSVAAHLGAATVLGFVQFAGVAWIFERLGGGPAGAQLRGFIAAYTLPQYLVYALLVALVYGAHHLRAARVDGLRAAGLAHRAAHLERESSGARIDALRRELDTHLVLNALTSASARVRERDGDAALRLLAALGGMIRAGAEDGGAPEVPLRRELELLDRYLEVARLGGRGAAGVRVHVDDDVLDARVPPLLLQPLVENALVHSAAAAGPSIEVRARRAGRRLWLEVRDRGARPAGPRPERTGLGNTRARLALLHGDAAEVRLETLGDGARAVVVLPFAGADHARG